MLYGIGTELCLDDAIRNSAAHLANGIGSGARVAVVSMESGSARMSNYLVDGMIDTLIDIGGFGVVKRNMTVFRSYSGEALGKKTLLLSFMGAIDKHSGTQPHWAHHLVPTCVP